MPDPCSNNNKEETCLRMCSDEEYSAGSIGQSSSVGGEESTNTSSVQAQVTAEHVNVMVVGEGDSGSSSAVETVDCSFNAFEDVRAGVRICDFDDDEDSNQIPCVEVGYVNASGLSPRSVWGESLQLSEMLHRPVVAIPNAGGRACSMLARGLGLSNCCQISANHSTVRALLRTWYKFFLQEEAKVFLQIYYGDGGLFVERALQLFSWSPHCLRIRVVGINPSFFVSTISNRYFYMSPGSCGRLLDINGYLAARQEGCVSCIPFSPYTQGIIPQVGDVCFELALRMEFMNAAGLDSLMIENLPAGENLHSPNLQVVRVVSSEESRAFTRLTAALNEDMRSSVRSGNPFPVPAVRLILLLTSLFRHALTATKAAYSYSPQSMSVLDAFDAGFTASYIGGVSSEIFLLCTNRSDRAHRLRLFRMLARLFSSWGGLIGMVELSVCYGVTINLLIQNDPQTSCTRNALLWLESTLTPVIILDLASRNFPRLWDAVVGLGMRIMTPSMWREERERIASSNQGNMALVRSGRRGRYNSRHHTAFGLSVELISVICGGLVQLMFVGLDGFNLRLSEECRTFSCNNTISQSSSHNITAIANTTNGCSNGINSTVRDIYPQIMGIRNADIESGSVARVLNTIRMIWCGVMLLYFLYTAFRLVRNSHRRN